MRLRAKPLPFCAECHVAYEPRDSDKRYSHLCEPHKREAILIDYERDRVMEWAWRTYKQLKPIADPYWSEHFRYHPFTMNSRFDSWRGK